ncbi:MAG: nucleotidyltransferase domain-containing protein, partial [Proteobacteria bacterium]|nr:nucleotidyltransferase domain-containing protein [Pseudomonadota bacterium]
LVVVKETEEKFIKRLKEVALMTRPKVGVDFLVYTPTEFKRMQERMNYFVLDEVIGRGKVIYDRQNS